MVNKTIRNEIVKKKCKYCKSKENLTYDHKIPLIQGGKDEKQNIQVLCKMCNGIKSGLSHKQVMSLFKWFLKIQEFRVLNGKRPYMLKDKRIVRASKQDPDVT